MFLLGGILGPQHAWDGPGASTTVPAATGGGGTLTPADRCDDYGNARTINTWFYSSDASSALLSKVLPTCDTDNDGIDDDSDLDDDNDGILDLTELPTDPLLDLDGDGIPDYLDPDYPGFTDVIFDGINDNFDLDLDGLVNSIDPDADGDGCFDVLEAGYTDVSPANGQVDGTGFGPTGLVLGSNGYGTIADVNANGVDDYLELVDTDFDGIEDACDPELNDTDNDGVPDVVDLDDDNDGILDTDEIDCAPSPVAINKTPPYGLNTDFNSSNIASGTISGLGEYPNMSAPTPVNFDFSYEVSGSAVWVDGVELKSNVSLGPDGVYINVEPNNTDFDNLDYATYTLEFNQPVNNLTFKWGGMDNGDFSKFEAFLGTSPRPITPFNLTNVNIPIANVVISGNSVASAASGANAPSNSILVSIPGTIDKLVIRAGKNNGSSGNATMQLYELSYCVDIDTDGDGIPDSQDVDSDNDGIPDIVEAGGTDADGDGLVDDLTDTDGDGLVDLADPDQGNTPFDLNDTDGDGIPDTRDLDSDNDGISDLVEVGGTDLDGDGVLDDLTDTDGDGLSDIVDPDNNDIPGSGDGPGTALLDIDSDRDGVINSQDLDSDNDGTPDVIEAGGTDPDGDGRIGTGPITDVDGDGFSDLVDEDDNTTPGAGDGGTNLPNSDADGDGNPDAQDIDSDNDGIADVIENGGTDADGDGIIGTGPITDSDGDGFSDITDEDDFNVVGTGDGPGTALPNTDTDLDGVNDAQDIDSDNDGIVDVIEAGGTDPDGDGRIGTGLITDVDGDGFSDAVDTDDNTTAGAGDGGTSLPLTNTDGITAPNHLDIDADNDGIPDNVEGQTTVGYTPPSGTDTDGDGLDDAYDTDCAPCGAVIGVAIVPVNTDNAADNPDYTDLDSDDDGENDILEGHDLNGNGIIDGAEKRSSKRRRRRRWIR